MVATDVACLATESRIVPIERVAGFSLMHRDPSNWADRPAEPAFGNDIGVHDVPPKSRQNSGLTSGVISIS